MDMTPTSRMMITILAIMSMLTLALAIRVDYNTNPGPCCRPPTTTLQPPPQPYRDPAPVREDQSNDTPNPNPYRYVPPPPSRPRYNNNNEIETNNIFDDKQSKPWKNQPNGFFVDVPPKFFKGNPAKQQYYQQQYLNNVLKDLYHKSNKYNVIAIKNNYHNVPYYVFYFARVPQQ